MIRVSLPDVPDRTGKKFDEAVKMRLETKLPYFLPSYTVQEIAVLAPANFSGALVRCSNGDAGSECLAFCNGRAWFVVELGSRVSIS